MCPSFELDIEFLDYIIIAFLSFVLSVGHEDTPEINKFSQRVGSLRRGA